MENMKEQVSDEFVTSVLGMNINQLERELSQDSGDDTLEEAFYMEDELKTKKESLENNQKRFEEFPENVKMVLERGMN